RRGGVDLGAGGLRTHGLAGDAVAEGDDPPLWIAREPGDRVVLHRGGVQRPAVPAPRQSPEDVPAGGLAALRGGPDPLAGARTGATALRGAGEALAIGEDTRVGIALEVGDGIVGRRRRVDRRPVGAGDQGPQVVEPRVDGVLRNARNRRAGVGAVRAGFHLSGAAGPVGEITRGPRL